MTRAGAALLLATLACVGCAPVADPGADPGSDAAPAIYANRVVAYAPQNSTDATANDWPYFFQPETALGAPAGGMDVASLGFDPAATDALGGTIALGFGQPEAGGTPYCAADGAGADLAVYENPFATLDPDSGVSGSYVEVALVQVSADGEVYYQFPPMLDPAKPLDDPARYGNFAGVTATAAGGDRFDLGELIDLLGLPADFQACFVRLTDGGTRYPDFGNTQSDTYASGADIDAVEALHPEAAAGPLP